MIIYEVNLDVDADVADAYAAWLREHISRILAIDGFIGATWMEDLEAEGPSRKWTLHYTLRDREAFDAYIRDHADAMRRDGMERFRDTFRATRRLLNTVETFSTAQPSEAA